MAVVKFTRKGKTPSGADKLEAKFIRVGGIETPAQMTGADMLKPRMGTPGFVPRGTDTDAPRKAAD
jgi:hypothetical protein